MSRTLPLAILGLLAATAPARAAGNFDGTYRGSQTTIRTNNSTTCAHLDRDNVVVRVVNDSFTRQWGSGKYGGDKITVQVAPDGSFKGEALADTTVRRSTTHQYRMHGRIAGGVLEGEIGSKLCAVKMTLRKS